MFRNKKIKNLVRNFLNYYSINKKIFLFKRVGKIDLFYLQLFYNYLFFNRKSFFKEMIIKLLVKDLMLKGMFKFNKINNGKYYKLLITSNNKFDIIMKLHKQKKKIDKKKKVNVNIGIFSNILNLIILIPRLFLLINFIMNSRKNYLNNYSKELITIITGKFSNIFNGMKSSFFKRNNTLMIYLNSMFLNLKIYFEKFTSKKIFKLVSFKNLFLKNKINFYFFKNKFLNLFKTNLFHLNFSNFVANQTFIFLDINFFLNPILVLPQFLDKRNYYKNFNFIKKSIAVFKIN